jgi:hypothetical protein
MSLSVGLAVIPGCLHLVRLVAAIPTEDVAGHVHPLARFDRPRPDPELDCLPRTGALGLSRRVGCQMPKVHCLTLNRKSH